MVASPAHRLRTVLVTAVVLVSSVGVGLSGASTVDDLREDLDETRDRIEDAEDDLARTREELGSVTEQVRAADATVRQLEADLAALEAERAQAEATAAGAARRTADAREELATLDGELEATEEYLDEREALLRDRAVSAFKHGQVDYAAVVVESESVTDFVNTTYYIRTVLLNDRAIVDDVADLAAQLAVARAEADRLRELVEAEQRAADAAAATAVALAEEQERVTVLAESERDRRAALLRELEVHEAATEAQLAEYAAESAALEEELRNLRWRAGAPGAGTWVWPTSGTITSPYGYRTHPIYGGSRLHTGVDVSGGWGQEIVAANDGLVVAAYCSGGGYGCRVVLDHGGGMASLYAHQSSFAVAEGQVVTAGQVIGYVGSTGASTGPHLHFEIRREGVPEDPMQQY